MRTEPFPAVHTLKKKKKRKETGNIQTGLNRDHGGFPRRATNMVVTTPRCKTLTAQSPVRLRFRATVRKKGSDVDERKLIQMPEVKCYHNEPP